MTMKFRTPTRCQNGHFRWYYYKVEFGKVDANWGTASCKCSTHDWNEGFDKIADDEQFVGLRDTDGIEIYENDILEVTNSNLAGYGNTFVVLRSKDEAGFIEGHDGGVLSVHSIEDGMMCVAGNVHEVEL